MSTTPVNGGQSSQGQRSFGAVALPFPPDLPLALMDIAIGLIYLFSRHPRINLASLRIARELFPFVGGDTSIRIWGCTFLFVGLALLFALKYRKQSLLTIVRVGGTALYFMWAMMYLISGIQDSAASFIGVPAFLYLSYRHSFAPVKEVGRVSRL